MPKYFVKFVAHDDLLVEDDDPNDAVLKASKMRDRLSVEYWNYWEFEGIDVAED
jgi:hypothetical protein